MNKAVLPHIEPPEGRPVDRSVNQQEFPHYFKEIVPKVFVDVYQVLGAFATGDPAIDHAVKKLLVPGKRGAKSSIKDRQEAIKSIQRSIEIDQLWSLTED